MANIKLDASLLNMATIVEQQQQLKKFFEGKIPTQVHTLKARQEEDPLEEMVFTIYDSRNFP